MLKQAVWSQKLWQKFRNSTWIGWIPGFLGILNLGNETWIWIAHIVELRKSFSMIPNSNRFPGNWTSEINLCTFVWALDDATNFIVLIFILLGWFWEWNTHEYGCQPHNSKLSFKVSKSNSHGIGPKFSYLRNQHDSLNQLLFLKKLKSLT